MNPFRSPPFACTFDVQLSELLTRKLKCCCHGGCCDAIHGRTPSLVLINTTANLPTNLSSFPLHQSLHLPPAQIGLRIPYCYCSPLSKLYLSSASSLFYLTPITSIIFAMSLSFVPNAVSSVSWGLGLVAQYGIEAARFALTTWLARSKPSLSRSVDPRVAPPAVGPTSILRRKTGKSEAAKSNWFRIFRDAPVETLPQSRKKVSLSLYILQSLLALIVNIRSNP